MKNLTAAIITFIAPLLVMSSSAFAEEGLVRAKSFCTIANGELFVQNIIEIDYTFSGGISKALGKAKEHSRALFSIQCNVASGACDGMRFRLDSVDRGEPVGLFDITVIKGMSVVSKTGNVFTLVWGPYRTFTLDLGLHRVEYRESADETEGRGTASCSDKV